WVWPRRSRLSAVSTCSRALPESGRSSRRLWKWRCRRPSRIKQAKLSESLGRSRRSHVLMCLESLMSKSKKKDWKTKLIHSDASIPQGFESLNVPVYRASTVLFPNAAAATDHWNQYDVGYTYGLYGTPTVMELAARVCELEKGFRTIITPGGQAAISLIHLALLKSGDHVLLPENIYAPNRKCANELLRRFGVEVSYYPPDAGAGIASAFRENTRLVWCESPGSITMEVQDIPAIVATAHARGALVVL